MRPEKKLLEDALSISDYAISCVDGEKAIKSSISLKDDKLIIGTEDFHIKDFKRVYLLGAGKVAIPMMRGIKNIMDKFIHSGVVVTHNADNMREITPIRIMEASHPLPDKRSIEAGCTIRDFLKKTEQDDLVIFLLSGGASSLLSLPVEGITLDDVKKTTKLLSEAGGNIQELNAIRKHISKIKGGWLALVAYPSTVIVLVLSDVIENRLDAIGSGPFYPDSTSFKDCWKIVEKYNLASILPPSVIKYLAEGVRGNRPETPKAPDNRFSVVKHFVVADNRKLLRAAMEKAQKLGYNTTILTTSLEGEAKELGKFLGSIVKEVKRNKRPISPPACILLGGEPTVTVKGKGMGGRCTELILQTAISIADEEGIFILAEGTDGTDGVTDASGAYAHWNTVKEANMIGLDPLQFLLNNDSYNFFKKTEGLLKRGITNTNCMDIIVLIVT